MHYNKGKSGLHPSQLPYKPKASSLIPPNLALCATATAKVGIHRHGIVTLKRSEDPRNVGTNWMKSDEIIEKNSEIYGIESEGTKTN